MTTLPYTSVTSTEKYYYFYFYYNSPEAMHRVGEGPWNTILFNPSIGSCVYVQNL